ncbi:hypothetical protein [Microbacterium rhizophilus]|uniref:hypothetical protein n=1 Tax=Microbacterium rhizophilus TaxID=3138934 RepID=UPI0031EECA24
MSPDESRISYPVDTPRPETAPVSARSTSTESIPIVSGDIDMQPVENRRMRRARLVGGDTGESPIAGSPAAEAPRDAVTGVPSYAPPAAPAPPYTPADAQPASGYAQPAMAGYAPSAYGAPTTPAFDAPAETRAAWLTAQQPHEDQRVPDWMAPAESSTPPAAPFEAPTSLDAPITEPAAPPVAAPGKAPKPGRVPKPTKAPKAKPERTPKPEKAGKRPKAPKGAPALKPPKAPQQRPDQLAIGGVPKVDLLPPELKDARAWRRARGRALIIILCGMLVLLAGVLATTWLARTSTDARDAAQARTDELLAMQSEFVEVNAVQGGIAAAEQALAQAGATDILWTPTLADLRASLPAQARITALTIDASNPSTPLAAPTDVLEPGDRVATVTFTALTPRVPDVSTWVRAVEQIGGVVFVAPRVTQVLEDEPGYTVEMTFDIGAERLRNAPAPEDDATAEEEGQ